MYNNDMNFTLSTDCKSDVMVDYLDAYGIEFLATYYFKVSSEEAMLEPSTDEDFAFLHGLAKEGKRLTRREITRIDYEQYFDDLLEKRRRSVLHIAAFGREYTEACRAAAIEALKFPRKSVFVLPCRSFSCAMQPLIVKGYELMNAGYSLEEAYAELSVLNERLTTLVCVSHTDGLRHAGFKVAPTAGKVLDTRSVFEFCEAPYPLFKARSVATAADRIAKRVVAETDGPVYISSAADRTATVLTETLRSYGIVVKQTLATNFSVHLLSSPFTIVAYERKP